MAGSLRLVTKPDTWELRVYVGRDANGRVKHRYQRFQGPKRAAAQALADLVAEVRAGAEGAARSAKGDRASKSDGHWGPPANGRWGTETTLNEAFAAWQENGWSDLSPSTTRRYESIWSVHVAPTIGSRRIVELGPYDLERFFRDLKASGLAEATVRQTRAVLGRTCRLARRWSGGVLPNPVSETELPSWTISDKQAVRAPKAEEVRAILRAAHKEDLRLWAFTRVVTATGMRRGETCALRWSDVDAEHGVLTVNESVVAAHGGAAVKSPKTLASIRRIVIDAGTLRSLAELQAYQSDLARACGVVLQPDGFVFSSEPGGPIPPYPDAMSHAFAKVRSAAGVSKDIHLHSLRHFQATAIDAVVSEKQKQARLGWATVHMARHYTDSVEAEDHKAADHVGRVLDAEDE